MSLAPRLDASVTDLARDRAAATFFKVTVMVDVAVPSATSVDGEAVTVELAALTAVAVKVTLAVAGA